MRSDGAVARSRILAAATGLFAHRGYKQTGIRCIALAAGVNTAAIYYYFGGKAELYRAALCVSGAPERAGAASPRSLRDFFVEMLAPLREGEAGRLRLVLQCRELIDPFGMADPATTSGLGQLHAALSVWLAGQFGLEQGDGELDRIALSLIGLGAVAVMADRIGLEPSARVHCGDFVISEEVDRLSRHAEAIVLVEQARRR